MRRNRKAALFVASMSLFAADFAHSATYTWNISGNANASWGTNTNWTPNVPASFAIGDIAIFNGTGQATAGMVTNNVDQNISISSVIYNLTSATSYHTTSIPSGVTLTLANSNSPSNTSSVQANSSLFVTPSSATSTRANVQITGSGELRITDGNLVVSGKLNSSGGTDSGAVLDLTGLSKFTYDRSSSGGGVLRVGGGDGTLGGTNDGQYWGKMILGDLSNIAVGRITVGGDNGGNSGNAQPLSILAMGTSNNINNGWTGSTAISGSIYVGADPRACKVGSGAIINGIGLTGANAPVTTVGDASHHNALEIGEGHVENQSAHSSFGVVDFTSASGMNADPSQRVSDGTINAYFGDVIIGKGAVKTETGPAESPISAGDGMLSFDHGTVIADGIVLGSASSTSNNKPNLGYLNVGLRGDSDDFGGGALQTTSITLGDQTVGNTGSLNVNMGVLNVGNSGSVAADKIYVGNNTSGTASVTGELNIGSGTGGGLVTTGKVQAGNGTQTGSPLRIVNFNGGTLQAKLGTTGTDALSYLTGMTSANVFAGGGAIDTNGSDITIAQPLVTPAGSGVSSINWTGGSGYRVAPIVYISGGTGSGATAVAKINSDGTINSIVITNPGTGYSTSDVLTVSLVANGSIGSGGAASLSSWQAMTVPYGGSAATVTAVLSPNSGGGITKIGDGVLTLTGVNTYPGATTIKAGTLKLSGSFSNNISSSSSIIVGTTASESSAKLDVTGLTSGAITLTSNQTLQGYGSVNGAVVAAAGSSVSPGGSVGTLTTGAFTLQSNATLLADVDYTNNNADQILVSGTNASAVLSGKLEVQFIGLNATNASTPHTFTLIHIANNNTGAVSQNFSAIMLSDNSVKAFFSLYTDPNDSDGVANDLAVTFAVPEPATLGLLALGGMMMGRRSRRRGRVV